MKIRHHLTLISRKFLVSGGLATIVFVVGLVANQALAETSQPVVEVDQRVISIYDRGVERVIITKARTVRQALELAKIDIQEDQDVVEPALDTELIASKYSVNIHRARPVTIEDGVTRRQITTAEQTAANIARVAGVKLYPEDNVSVGASDTLLVDGANIVMKIDRATPITLSLYGKETEIRTRAKTVADLLEEKQITLEVNDTLSVSKTTPITSGMKIELWRNGVQTVVVDEEIDFTTEKIKDTNREAGYREVKQAGEKGSKTVTYEIEMRNGVEVGRREIAKVVTKEPKKQIEVIGAKFNYTGGPLNEEQITALGMCESGMTATRNSGNGFYGAFQFMPSTWRNVAPSEYKNVLPHEAPLEAQKQAVQNLLSRSSIYTQFPGCAKKMQAQGLL